MSKLGSHRRQERVCARLDSGFVNCQPTVRCAVAFLLLLLTAPRLHGDTLTGGGYGIDNSQGCSIPLTALASYAGGRFHQNQDGQIVCEFGEKQFKLRLGSKNLFINNTLQELNPPTTTVGNQVYVDSDLPHKLGWTIRPAPTGYIIRRPGSANCLIVSSRKWKIKPWKASDVQVGVWYMTIFTAKDEYNHWTDIERRADMVKPLSGRYGSGEPEVMERHWREMSECGVDFMVMEDTNTVWVDNSLINKNIRSWYDFMDSKPEQERIGMAIVTGGELNQHNDRQGWLKAIDYLYETYANRPSYLHENAKPVLQWYIEKDVWPDWTDERWTIRKTYHFFRNDRIISGDGWGYGCDPAATRPKNCFSMHPGWNLSPPGHLRDGGNLYSSQWVEALKLHPKYVFISVWNGWNEGDALEDSASWKDTYGDSAPSWYRHMTQGYVAAIKGDLIDGFYYREEGSASVYRWENETWAWQGAFPHKIPVIVVPKGMLYQLSGKTLPEPG